MGFWEKGGQLPIIPMVIKCLPSLRNYLLVAFHLHAPHPQKVLPKYSVELIRDFLIQIGVKPYHPSRVTKYVQPI